MGPHLNRRGVILSKQSSQSFQHSSEHGARSNNRSSPVAGAQEVADATISVTRGLTTIHNAPAQQETATSPIPKVRRSTRVPQTYPIAGSKENLTSASRKKDEALALAAKLALDKSQAIPPPLEAIPPQQARCFICGELCQDGHWTSDCPKLVLDSQGRHSQEYDLLVEVREHTSLHFRKAHSAKPTRSLPQQQEPLSEPETVISLASTTSRESPRNNKGEFEEGAPVSPFQEEGETLTPAANPSSPMPSPQSLPNTGQTAQQGEKRSLASPAPRRTPAKRYKRKGSTGTPGISKPPAPAICVLEEVQADNGTDVRLFGYIGATVLGIPLRAHGLLPDMSHTRRTQRFAQAD